MSMFSFFKKFFRIIWEKFSEFGEYYSYNCYGDYYINFDKINKNNISPKNIKENEKDTN